MALIGSIIRPVIGSIIRPIIGGDIPLPNTRDLVIWNRADVLSSVIRNSNNRVSAWNSLLNNGNDLTQSTLKFCPFLSYEFFNFRPSIYASADNTDDDRLALNDNATLKYTNFTCCVVVQFGELNRLQSIVSKYQASGTLREFNLRITSTNKLNLQYSTNGSTASTMEAPETLALNTPYIIWFGWNNGTLFLRGDKITTTTVSSAAIFNSTNAFALFERTGGDRGQLGITEILFARRAWSEQEIAAYQNVLQRRWLAPIASVTADNATITADSNIITTDRM